MSIASEIRFTPLGDTAVLVESASETPLALPTSIDGRLASDCLPGVHDVVPAFGMLGIYFDPDRAEIDAVIDWVRSRLRGVESGSPQNPRTVEIAVCYAGEHGPDLERVAQHAGLSCDEVARRHASTEFTVGAIGFQPGFPYLIGLPPTLHTPRLESPRTAVPAGAVGIGGSYTGVYPHASPGGWNLIGRTPELLFDSQRDPACLLAVGDRVRFEPIEQQAYVESAPHEVAPREAIPTGDPVLRIKSGSKAWRLAGPPTLGQQHIGIGPGGPMDRISSHLANALVGSGVDCQTAEIALNGPVLEAVEPVTLGLAGALPDGLIGPSRIRLARGGTLDLRQLRGGCRCYLAIRGGFTSLHDGRLWVDRQDRPPMDEAHWSLNHRAAPPRDADGNYVLRTLPGPHHTLFDADSLHSFCDTTYEVTARSDRTAVRLRGPEIRSQGVETLQSLPVVQGAVQVPPDGQPVVLGPDRYTLGGYPIIGAVVSADWPLLAQLRPGDPVRFQQVTPQEAAQARHTTNRLLTHLLTAMRLQTEKG